MKNITLTMAFILFSSILFAQSTNDRRGFQGTVNSGAKQTIRPDGKDDTTVKTTIEFNGRAIIIEGETYDIVKKSFDGKNQTVFTCTKRRGTFDITYTIGESIKVVDATNKDIVTVYLSLTEN